MKLVITIVIAVAAAMIFALWDFEQARATRTRAENAFSCRVPAAEGDMSIVTFTWRTGEIVAECQYVTTRRPKPKKGG